MALGYVLDRRALEQRPQRLARRDPSVRGWAQKKSDGRTARREGVAEVRKAWRRGCSQLWRMLEQRQGR